MAKSGGRLLQSHLLSIEPLEDRLLLSGFDVASTVVPFSPAPDPKPT